MADGPAAALWVAASASVTRIVALGSFSTMGEAAAEAVILV